MSQPESVKTHYYENRTEKNADQAPHVRAIIVHEDTSDIFVFPSAEDMQALLQKIIENKVAFLYSQRFNRMFVNLKDLREAYAQVKEFQDIADQFERDVLSAHQAQMAKDSDEREDVCPA